MHIHLHTWHALHALHILHDPNALHASHATQKNNIHTYLTTHVTYTNIYIYTNACACAHIYSSTHHAHKRIVYLHARMHERRRYKHICTLTHITDQYIHALHTCTHASIHACSHAYMNHILACTHEFIRNEATYIHNINLLHAYMHACIYARMKIACTYIHKSMQRTTSHRTTVHQIKIHTRKLTYTTSHR